MTSDRFRSVVALAALALTLAAGPARAQTGDQRVGTSSATFLAIGVGARATGIGSSFVAMANDPTAIFWNTAGLASLLKSQAQFSYSQWPGDVNYNNLIVVIPSSKLGGSLGFQIGSLSTEIEETTSYQPYGTGTTFTYSDLVVGAAYGRRWTDKLLVGAGLKYVHEDLGSAVGGPTLDGLLFDLGSIYYLGLGSVRIGVSLSNFGAGLQPSGSYVSPVTGETSEYDTFDPPLQFRYGVAFEAIENAQMRLTSSTEFVLPADNALVMKTGIEWAWSQRLALRTGYNFSADVLKFSAGAGLFATVAGAEAQVDYSYTDGQSLGGVNRLSLGVKF